jgi:hypothetical protein
MAVLSLVRRSLIAAALALCFMLASTHAAAPAREYRVKAVFLFNFSRFVEWPESAFRAPAAPFVVGVFGYDPFGDELDAVMRGESVDGHPLEVRRVASLAEAEQCQILFIHRSEEDRLDEVVDALSRQSTLTVSDVAGSAQRGVMVRLVNVEGHIRLRIDLDSARAAQLTISSGLLRSAEIVGSPTASIR